VNRLDTLRLGDESHVFEAAEQQLEAVPVGDVPEQPCTLRASAQKVPHEVTSLVPGEI
jgi:hypothetical protein